MDVLKECLICYSKLLNKKFVFTLSNSEVITLAFREENFYHLLGLHYLTDIAELKIKKKYLFTKIAQNKITFEEINKSIFITKIMDRINNFKYLNEIITTDKIIKFNSTKSYSRIDADYIMVKNKEGKYILLFMGKENIDRDLCPVSFFVTDNSNYIFNQKSIGIKNIEIIDMKTQEQAAATAIDT